MPIEQANFTYALLEKALKKQKQQWRIKEKNN